MAGRKYSNANNKEGNLSRPRVIESSIRARSGPTPNAAGLAREKVVSSELDAEFSAFRKRTAARKKKRK